MKRLLFLALVVCAGAFAQNAALMPLPRITFVDGNGAPLAGGYLRTCAAGTACTALHPWSTPANALASYTDATAGTPAANPIVLDAGGGASVWLGSSPYKIVLTDANGVTIWTQDNVSARNFAGVINGLAKLDASGLVPVNELPLGVANGPAKLDTSGFVLQSELNYNQGGTGAANRTVQNKLQESVSVKDFGATCNGTGTGDQTGFAAAVTYLTGLGGGTLNIPAGQCKPTATIAITVPVVVRGAGSGNTCALSPTCITFPATVGGFSFSVNAYKSAVRDLWLQGSATVAGTDDGILIQAQWFELHNATIAGFGRYGVNADSTTGNNTDHLQMHHTYLFSNKSHGYYCTGSDCNAQLLSNSAAYTNGGYGFYYNQGATNVLQGLDVNANTGGGYYLGGLSMAVSIPYCEGGTGNTLVLAGTHHQVWSPYFGGCTITNSGGVTNAIYTSSVSNYEGWTALNIVPQPGTVNSPTTFGFRSGVTNFGNLDLVDLTNGTSLYHYSPSNTTFTFDAPTVAAATVNATTAYKANGTAGGTATVNVRNSTNGGACTITYSQGLFISTTCP